MRSIQRKRWFVFSAAIAVLLAAAPAMAAVNAYMTVKGEKQGNIIDANVSDRIPLINVVRDAPLGSGMREGRQMHSTITVTKKIDMASPKLATAKTSGERLSRVVITFEGGKSEDPKAAEKIVLTNATIANIRWVNGNEEITFDYENIEVTYAKGGKSTTDDWEAPK